MNAAGCALLVTILYAMSNHRRVNGDTVIQQNFLEMIAKITDELKKPVSETSNYDFMNKMLDVEENLREQIADGFQNFQLSTQAVHDLRDFYDEIGKIGRKFSIFEKYTKNATTTFTLDKLTTKCVSLDDDGVPETLEKLHTFIKPDRGGLGNYNLLKLIRDVLEGRIDTHCSDIHSHQYLLYSLLNPILVAEVKGLVIMYLSYNFLMRSGQGNYTTEWLLARTSYQTRISETVDAFQTAMSTASLGVWRCDPPNWNGDDTYTELYRNPLDYIDIRSVEADIKLNKVITGMRFVKIESVIHLQVEQGELLREGMIANNTEWITPKPNEELLIVEGEEKPRPFTWKKAVNVGTAIDLDEIAAPPGHCLTGVRLRMEMDLHLILEILTTPFNFTTGRLTNPEDTSRWRRNYDTTQKTAVELISPDRSTRSRLPSINNFRTNQYVKLRPTDVDKDKGQSIVPFIDTQPVYPSPRVALAGAGIFHKGRDGYGGFIAPKVITYNFGPHLRTHHPISKALSLPDAWFNDDVIDDSVPN